MNLGLGDSAKNAIKKIGKGIADWTGFSTIANDFRSLLGMENSGRSGISDYLSRVGSYFPNSSTNSGVTENNQGSNSAIQINQDGSASYNGVNLNNLDQLGIVGLEAAVGGIPELQRMWNTAEAQKERDWQTEMSNSAYQRSMNDMKAAGLNPILAYSQGGATSASGASASGMVSSGANLGSTLQGVSSLIKTIMREDTKSDAQADHAAQAATKFTNPSSAQTAFRNYITFKKNAR